jgi:RHS repeat-associated protein
MDCRSRLGVGRRLNRPRPVFAGRRPLLAVLAALFALHDTTNFTAGITVFGPQTYVRATGKPVVEVSTFSIGTPTNPYTLRVANKGVTSAEIRLNGSVVFRPSDFKGSNTANAVLLAPVALLAGANQLSVELRSKPGSFLTIDIVGTANQPPIAVIAPVPPTFVGQLVVLDGSASSDPDGGPLTYSWEWVSRPAGSHANLSGTTNAVATFMPDRKGTYTASLTVDDGESTGAANVDVVVVNSPPVANAGPDQSVGVLDAVTVSGEASSDVDGDPLTYEWSFLTRPAGSVASLSIPSAVTQTFYPDVPGDYTLRLKVSDGTEATIDTVLVTTGNSPPSANAGPDQTVPVGGLVQLTGAATTDVDGQALGYQWSILSRPVGSSAALSNASSIEPTFIADKPGNYEVQLVAGDGFLNSAPDSVVVSTENSLPVANAGPDQTVALAATAQLNGSGSIDADGDPLTFSWALLSIPSGSEATLSDTHVVAPTFFVDVVGTYVAQLVVNDGTGSSVADTVVLDTINSPPVANAGADQTVPPGTVVTLDGLASSDVDGDPLTYAWALTSIPAGSTATLSAPTSPVTTFEADVPGDYRVQLIVNDGVRNSAPDTVVISTTNSKPIANAGPDQAALIGATVSLDGGASFDPDGTPLTFAWALTSRPEGSSAVLTESAGAFPNFVPDVSGSYLAQLMVSDGGVESAPDTVMVVVSANLPPQAIAGPDQATLKGALVRLDGSASTDPEGQPLYFGWVLIDRPVGSQAPLLSSDTATATFVPDVPGTYVALLTVSDGMFADDDATVVVASADLNKPPLVNAGADIAVALPGPAVLSASVSDDGLPAGSVVTLAWTTVSGPAAVVFANPTVAATTATFSATGTYTLRLEASDSALTGSDEVNVVVSASDNHVPSISDAGIAPEWTKLTPLGTPPVPKYGGSLQTYDEVNDRLIVFGGIGAQAAERNDTWVLSHATGAGGIPEWINLQPQGGGPSGRHNVISAYDPTANRLIVYAGCQGGCAQASDAWVLTNANGLGGVPMWLPLPSSNPLGFGVGGYDSLSNRLVVWGGHPGGSGSDTNDVKVLIDANGIGAPQWLALKTTGTPPPLRGHSQPGVYDPLSNSLFVFGGQQTGSLNILYNDVWILSHANGLGGVPNWTELHPAGSAPMAITGHSLAYDPNSNRLIVFGGYGYPNDTITYLNDTWVLTHANGQGGTPQWIKLTSGPSPHLSAGATVGYARSSNRLALAMGFSYDVTLSEGSAVNDVWVLSNASGNCTVAQVCLFHVTATDPDPGDKLVYSLDAAPAGMTIDAITGGVRWTPAVAHTGNHAITVRVTDSGGLFATHTFAAAVAAVAVPNVAGLAPEWAKGLIGAADLTVGLETSLGGAVTLNFDSLPSRQGWDFNDGPGSPGLRESDLFSVGAGLLHQNTLGIGGLFAGYRPDGAVRDQYFVTRLPLTISTRARVQGEEGGTSLNRFGLSFGAWSSFGIFLLGLGTDSVGLYEAGIDNRILPHDNTAFHDYVVQGTPGVDYRLFIDGALFHQGPSLRSGGGDYTLWIGDTTPGPNVRGAIAAYSYRQPRVVGQSPPPGTLVPNKTSVDLTIVEGPATEVVPDIVGLTEEEATAVIVAANLVPGPATSATSNIIPAGQVSDQSPLEGIRVPKDTPVSIVISTGATESVPPVITSAPVLTAVPNALYSYGVLATDANAGDILTLTLPTGPAGMAIDSGTGLITWTPVHSQIGNHAVTVRATDSQDLFVEQSYTLSVAEAIGNQPPAVNAGPDQTVALGLLLTLHGSATDDSHPSSAPLTFTWTVLSGPGAVTFGSPALPVTTASFGSTGTYVLVLSASDGELTGTDDVTVTVTDPTNQRPVVKIALIDPVQLPASAALSATMTDDGKPIGAPLTSQWMQVAGPGVVTFADDTATSTTASFDAPGVYVVRLSASDSELTGFDEIAIVVLTAGNQAPHVNAGPDQTITLPSTATLVGSARDDGLPVGTSLTYLWGIITAPGPVGVDEPGLTTVTAHFTVPGTYVLALQVDDGELTNLDTVVITVNPSPNQKPVVNAGPDLSITLPSGAQLSGSVTDDGLPAGASVTAEWTQVSGPGVAAFENAAAAKTGVTFSEAGTYVLRLTASDTELSAFDDVSVLARPPNQPPVTNAGPDREVELPASLILNYSFSDDGRPAGGKLTAEWFKLSGPGNARPRSQTETEVTFGFDAPGTYVLRLSVTDTQFTTVDDLTVVVTGAPPAHPVVEITSPTDGSEISAQTAVIGTVQSAALVSWRLEIRPADESAFRSVANGTTNVTNGALGTLDPTLLLNGITYVRVTAVDATGGSFSSAAVGVVLTRNQKVGNFTIAFQDVSVPTVCLPLTATRVYDSRDKRVGDFGVGWRLDLQSLRLHERRMQGGDWAIDQVAGPGGIPKYVLYETASHVVSVTLPDGHVERFDLVPSPRESIGFPMQEVSLSLVARPGTLGSLSMVGVTGAFILEGTGDVDLLSDEDGASPIDPQGYRYTAPDGTIFTIDKVGGLERVECTNGVAFTVSPAGMVHDAGTQVAFTRDAQRRITSITDPNGNTQAYTYDAAGDLVSHLDAEGNLTRYLYDNRHNLTEIIDPRGVRAARTEYDEVGRLIKTTDSTGKAVTFIHDLVARRETVADRLGKVTVHEYDADGNVLRTTDPLEGTTSFTYDEFGNELTRTDPLGRTTTYEYDGRRNRTSETNALNETTTYTYNSRNELLTVTDPLGRETRNTYDATGNLLSTRDPSGATTTYTYPSLGFGLPGASSPNPDSMTDALGRQTTYGYDNQGRLTRETNPLGHETTYEYDANGNRKKQTRTRTTGGGETESVVSEFEYDSENRLTRTIRPDGSTTQVEYDAIGKQSRTTDQLGRETRYTYDALGRLTRTTFPDGTRESSTYDAEGRRLTSTDRAGHVTRFEYDALGRLIKTIAPDGAINTTAYDEAGQVSSVTDAAGNTTLYSYDAAGRRSKVTDALGHETTFAYDKAGNQTSVTDAKGNATGFVYDASNRRIRTNYADGTFDETGYDAIGRATSKRDQAGVETQYRFDELGRLTAVVDALDQETSYEYDELGSRTSQTDANGHVTRFAYDAMGRRIRRTLPLWMFETQTYDAAGNLATKTDFNGFTTTYTYDLLNRLTSKIPDPTRGEPTVSFAYTATGQRAVMSDASGVTTYAYDERQRLLQKATPQGTLTYTYTDVGTLASIRSSNAGGTTVDYAYDALNRLSTVTDNRLENGVTTYAYDDVGNLASYTYPNTVTHSYTYNSVNRLTDLAVTNSSSTLASYSYTLGPTGNRTAVHELDGRTVNYTYDALYRLTSETITGGTVNGSIGYNYDPVGNRLERRSTVAPVPASTSTYDENDRLTSDAYDANGNTTASDGNTYAYDFENRLLKMNGGAVTMTYDGDGHRVARTALGATTQYLVDTKNLTGYAQVLEEVSNGIVQRVYAYGLHRISQSQAAGKTFFGYDGHGNVRMLTGSLGAQTDRYDYDAFGHAVRQLGNTPNSYLYSGEQIDASIDLVYLRARYLKLATGRFWTSDEFDGFNSDPRSLHRYLYAHASPVDSVDPSGRFTLSELSGTLSVATTLETFYAAYAKAGLRAIRDTSRVASGILGPGAVMQEVGLAMIERNVPGGFYVYDLGRNLTAVGFHAVLGILKRIYPEAVNEALPQLEIKINDVTISLSFLHGVITTPQGSTGLYGSDFATELDDLLESVGDYIAADTFATAALSKNGPAAGLLERANKILELGEKLIDRLKVGPTEYSFESSFEF